MTGALTGRDVALHIPTIPACYGARVPLRCAVAVVLRRRRTFLELAVGRA